MRSKLFATLFMIFATMGHAAADPVTKTTPVDISEAASKSADSRWVMEAPTVSEPEILLDDIDFELTEAELKAIRMRREELKTPATKPKRRSGLEIGIRVDGGTSRVPN